MEVAIWNDKSDGEKRGTTLPPLDTLTLSLLPSSHPAYQQHHDLTVPQADKVLVQTHNTNDGMD